MGQLEPFSPETSAAKASREIAFENNLTSLKNEINQFYLLNQNLQGLAYYQTDKKGKPKLYTDRDKSGFKIYDIKVNKRAFSKEVDKIHLAREILELNYAIAFKRKVTLNRQSEKSANF